MTSNRALYHSINRQMIKTFIFAIAGCAPKYYRQI